MTDVTSTGWPGWEPVGLGSGPFSYETSAVRAGAGTYSNPGSGRWRFVSPHSELRMVGGRVVGTANTVAASMNAQIRIGRADGQMQALFSSPDITTFDETLPLNTRWFDVGMATGFAAGLSNSQSVINITRVEMLFDDLAQPSGSLVTPALSGPSCAPVTIFASDRAGGIRSVVVQIDETGQNIGSWAPALSAGPHPGPGNLQYNVCLDAATRRHGTVHARITVSDVGGNVATSVQPIRSDLISPTLTGLPNPGQQIEAELLARTATSTDADSGLARITTTIDGKPDLGSIANGVGIVRIPRLAPGPHQVQVNATDAVGNTNNYDSSFTVVDNTPPNLSLTTSSDDQSEYSVEGTASDASSGVDQDSWALQVDGRRRNVSGGPKRLSGEIGRLAPGTHDIDVSVADHAGNISRSRAAIVVSQSGGEVRVSSPQHQLRMSGVPTRSIPAGSTIAIGMYARDSTHPLTGHRITAHNDGGQLVGRDITDVNGKAELRMRVNQPMQLTISLENGSTHALKVRVHPRLTLRVRTPTVTVGRRAMLTGTVHGKSRLVRVQTRIAGTWVTIRDRIGVSRSGTFRTTVVGSAAGRYPLRVQSIPADGWTQGTSPPASLIVTQSKGIR